MSARYAEAPVEVLVAEPQVRTEFDQVELDGLTESIRSRGIIQPILAKRAGSRLRIIKGERRFRAACAAGLKTVPVLIVEGQDEPTDVLLTQLVANCHRSDLSAIERAMAFKHLIETTGWTASQAAAQLGLSSASISRDLKLLNLPNEIQAHIKSKQIPASTAYQLTKIEDPAKQVELAAAAANGQLTRDAASAQIRRPAKRSAKRTNSRFMSPLSDGRAVTIAGVTSLDSIITTLEELLAKARKARSQGWELGTFSRALRDQVKSVSAQEG